MNFETTPSENIPSPLALQPGLFLGRLSRWAWLCLLCGLGLLYALLNSAALTFIPPGWRYYLLYPVLWLGLGGLAWWAWRQPLLERPQLSRGLLLLALGSGLAQVAVFLLFGLVWSFGRSPYAHHFWGILGNLFFVGSSLVGLEMARAYLVARRRSLGVFILIALSFALMNIPLAFYMQMKDPQSTLQALGREVLPQLAESLLTTYLVWLGGPLASIAYRGALLAFEWFSPILPRMPWLGQAFVGTMTPVVLLLLINQAMLAQEKQEAQARSQRGSVFWAVLALLAVSLLWLNAGFFGIRPFLVSGVSMLPTYHTGDVVIVRQVPPEQVQVGDVILFKGKGGSIVHRVVEIQEQDGQRIFITKGDNNNTLDDPVTPEEYGGKAVGFIPRVGWIAIIFRKVLAWVL